MKIYNNKIYIKIFKCNSKYDRSTLDWSIICGDSWSLFEAGVVCHQLGLGYASDAVQTHFFGNGKTTPISISGVQCRGNESNLAECLHDKVVDCPGTFDIPFSFVAIRLRPEMCHNTIPNRTLLYYRERDVITYSKNTMS